MVFVSSEDVLLGSILSWSSGGKERCRMDKKCATRNDEADFLFILQGRPSDEMRTLLSRLSFVDLTEEALEVIRGTEYLHLLEAASTDQSTKRSKRVKPSNQGIEHVFSMTTKQNLVPLNRGRIKSTQKCTGLEEKGNGVNGIPVPRCCEF